MTRFAIDAEVALRLIRYGVTVADEHRLVAPSRLRSDVLSLLYRESRAGGLDDRRARAELDGLAELKIRLLGDRVSRATAWRLAGERGWDDVAAAEYLAVAALQSDRLVTDDGRLTSGAAGVIPTMRYADFVSAVAASGPAANG